MVRFLGPIKDIFSRRMKALKGEIPEYYSYDLDSEIRYKLIQAIAEHYLVQRVIRDEVEYDEFKNLVSLIEEELGKSITTHYNASDDLSDFLLNCQDADFLTGIEFLLSLKVTYLMQSNIYHPICNDEKMRENITSFIDKVNRIFKIDKIGYEIVPAGLENLPYIIVPFNSKYLYLETIKRPMSLMHDEDFEGPLNEFEEALDEYRKGKYEDAIFKAGKAYESTLKAILDLKGIAHTPGKTKVPGYVRLIKEKANIIDPWLQSTFEHFWPLLENGPPALRNLPKVGHGQGKDVLKKMKKSYADYALRLAGTHISFLIERYQETK